MLIALEYLDINYFVNITLTIVLLIMNNVTSCRQPTSRRYTYIIIASFAFTNATAISLLLEANITGFSVLELIQTEVL